MKICFNKFCLLEATIPEFINLKFLKTGEQNRNRNEKKYF